MRLVAHRSRRRLHYWSDKTVDQNEVEIGPVVETRFCKFDEAPSIGAYGRIQRLVWKDKKPDQSIVTFVDNKPVSAMRLFLITMGQPQKARVVAGVTILEGMPPVSVVAIGALGTVKEYEGQGYMGRTLDFLIDQFRGKTAAIVALTKQPDGGMWTKRGFVLTKAGEVNGNVMIAKVFNKDSFDIQTRWKVPFHF